MTKTSASDSSDNTACNRVEKAINAQEQSYRTLAENLPGIVYRVHIREKGRMQFFNNDSVIAEVNAAVKDNRSFTIEYRITHKDGTLRFFFEQGRPVFDNGELHYLDGIILDITERKRVEDALRESDGKLKMLFEILPVGVAVVNTKGKIAYMNPALEKIIRLNCKEMQQGDYKPRTHLKGDGTPMTVENFAGRQAAREQRAIYNVETGIVMEGGDVVWTNVSAVPVTFKDWSAVIVTADITERKRAAEEHLKYEQQILQNQKLESLGVLAGGIAHDFNNLMGGIFGYIDLAIAETDKINISKYLSKAMNTIDRARALTYQLLTFAKGGAPIQKIGHLFPFVQESAQFALSGANVSCCFKVPGDLWASNFDKNQIGQVIDNIIINAQQAMPVGGAIELTARNITLAEKEHPLLVKGNYVKISVKDSGVGIPKELITKIVDPFFTTKTKGHGLGLATCYSIIKRHGGAIDVESEPGKGSTFHFYLPASTNPVSSSTDQPVTMHKGSGTFLVMDDEEVIRETIRRILTSFGYTVVCKVDGKDAVDFIASEIKDNRTVAGTLFDLTIPGGMGGKVAVEEVRKLNTEIPVFVASGYAEDPVMKNPVDYGFTASICKPFRIEELSEMLNKYVKPSYKTM